GSTAGPYLSRSQAHSRHKTDHGAPPLVLFNENDPSPSWIDAVPYHRPARDLDWEVGLVMIAGYDCHERYAVLFTGLVLPDVELICGATTGRGGVLWLHEAFHPGSKRRPAIVCPGASTGDDEGKRDQRYEPYLSLTTH